ncbi:MAG TPA: arginine--tRNA ligase [Solirubrobacteraceae bacterium]|nr:arginine--tRNA ligase [Solirubrobacteraceae bacterium]
MRLSDEWMDRVAEDSVSRDDLSLRTPRLAPSRRAAVYFWGANTTKALHVGHLRDLAVGNALAATLETSGMTVDRRSLVSDIGRGMGEAMAGVVGRGMAQCAMADLPEKSDHFVGSCYAEYVRSSLAAEGDEEAALDSLSREFVMHEDLADLALREVLGGDPEVRGLWERVRGWVLAGHEETLARLNIVFDKVICESEYLSSMVELGEVGLRAGRLTRREDNVVVYLTGHDELDEMSLVRPDGLPTQHMRALAYWAVAPEHDGLMSIQVCGAEWVAHVRCRQKLIDDLSEILPDLRRSRPTHTVFHGMVAEAGRRLASSQGAFRLDDLIDRIETEIDDDSLRRECRERLGEPGHVGGSVALGYFLPHPTGRAVEFDPEDFLKDGHSLGWDLLRARAHARAEVAHRHDVSDPDYRFVVIRAELFRYLLRSASEELDVTRLARSALHFARWCLERSRSADVNGAALLVLDQAERALGLSRAAGGL